MENYSDNIGNTIRSTPVPQLGPQHLMGPLLGDLAKKEMLRELELAKQLVAKFDELIERHYAIVEAAMENIGRLNRRLEIKPENKMDYVFTPGSLGSLRADWCYFTTRHFQRTRELVDHRNRWARLLGVNASNYPSLVEMKKHCELDAELVEFRK